MVLVLLFLLVKSFDEGFKFLLDLTDFLEILGQLDSAAGDEVGLLLLVFPKVLQNLLHIFLQSAHLSVGELLSESVACDDQHSLDPPEQNHIIALQLRVNKVSLVVVEASLAEVTVRQRLLQEVSAIQLMPRVFDQHRVDFHRSCLQVLPHCGDLVVGQVRCVFIVELQQALQLVFCFITNVLIWSATRPVHPSLRPAWTHHISDN